MAAPKKLRGKIGVIGLGIIGTRVAANLRSAGHQVYVWSRTPRAAPNFLGSVVEVADLCDVIQLFISDDGALHEVIRTVAAALRPRHVVLCHATVSPAATRQAAGIVESQGARYLDAPFTGSKAAAQNRQLVYYIGGAKPALEEVRPVLEATSKAILHVGGIGDASVVKIATNMLTASTVQTLAEALALVRAAGIDPSKFVEALENNGSRSGTSDLKLPAMITANTEPNFSLKHMLKDVRFAQELADKYELSLPVTDTTAEVFALGMQNDWGDQDFSVVAQLYPAPATETPLPEPAAKPTPVPVTSATALATPKPEPAAVESTPVPPPLKSDPAIEKPAPVPVLSAPMPVVPKPAPAAESSASVSVAPESEAVASSPVASSATVTEKPVSAGRQLLVPIPENQVAGLLLPPRPESIPKPASADEPVSTDKPQDKAAGDAPAKTSANEPALIDKKDDPAAAKKDDETVPVEPVKKREVRPANGTAPNAAEAAKREKKSTLKFLRDFFKSVPTKPN